MGTSLADRLLSRRDIVMREVRDELRDHDEIDRLEGVGSVSVTVRFQSKSSHEVSSVSCEVGRTRRKGRSETKRAVVLRRDVSPDDGSPPYEDR